MTDRAPGSDERSRHRQGRDADDARLNGLARRLDKPMGVLGILFLLVLLGQALAHDQPLATVLTVASWVLWAVFIAEFALRAWLARHTAREFWKRNWWQLIFLAVPFLRFARAATALRAARGTGVVAAAVRGSRSAGRLLTDRLAGAFRLSDHGSRHRRFDRTATLPDRAVPGARRGHLERVHRFPNASLTSFGELKRLAGRLSRVRTASSSAPLSRACCTRVRLSTG
nr:hypothetical protein [Micromonospora sp. ATA51]